MPRLPKIGADAGNWGQLLNDFLSVEHNHDGSLKRSAMINASEQAGNKGKSNGYASLDATTRIPTTQLGGSGADNTKFLRGDRTWAIPPSAVDATNSTKGLVKLGGDLGGTADAPTVPNKLDKSGGTLTGDLVINGTAESRALSLLSSFAGGENDTDSTSRLNLESYQRAQLNNTGGQYAEYGEVIRIFSRRWDSKQMIAWYGPTAYNPDGTPATNPVTWFWMGAHYEANNHDDVHGHWSVEVPDASGQMQTRFEMRIWDPVTGAFGMDRTLAKFNAADVVVEESNGSFQIAAAAGTYKNIYFNNDSLAANSGKRWGLQADATTETGANAGTDFRINAYDDTGNFSSTPMFIKRSSGQIGINQTNPSAQLDVAGTTELNGSVSIPTSTLAIGNASAQGGASLYIERGSSAVGMLFRNTTVSGNTAANIVSQAQTSSSRLFQGGLQTDSVNRISIEASGLIEWGAGGASGRDTNLYRNAANSLKTDDSLEVAANFTLSSPTVPATSVSPGAKGQIAYDSSYMYVCVGTNIWKRVGLNTW